MVPFFTIFKSKKMCGKFSGASYDDPHGNLLVWLNLGGRRQTSWWPQITTVNLTLVVTAYQRDCDKNGPAFNGKTNKTTPL